MMNEDEEKETRIVDAACAIFHSMRDENTYQAKKHFERELRPVVRQALRAAREEEGLKLKVQGKK